MHLRDRCLKLTDVTKAHLRGPKRPEPAPYKMIRGRDTKPVGETSSNAAGPVTMSCSGGKWDGSLIQPPTTSRLLHRKIERGGKSSSRMIYSTTNELFVYWLLATLGFALGHVERLVRLPTVLAMQISLARGRASSTEIGRPGNCVRQR